jgi:enamine deaminase RidA (YjgF/YER057c/UK114 family)
MSLEYIKPPTMNNQRAAELAYGYGVRSDNLVFISGQVARDEEGNTVGVDDPALQATTVFDNMRKVVEAAGGTMADIICIRTMTTSRATMPFILEARKQHFPGPNYPTAAYLIVAELSSPEYLVEIEAIAHLRR